MVEYILVLSNEGRDRVAAERLRSREGAADNAMTGGGPSTRAVASLASLPGDRMGWSSLQL